MQKKVVRRVLWGGRRFSRAFWFCVLLLLFSRLDEIGCLGVGD